MKLHIWGPSGMRLIISWYTDEPLEGMFSTFGSPFGNMNPISFEGRCCCCAAKNGCIGMTGSCFDCEGPGPGPSPDIARFESMGGWFMPNEKPWEGPSCCLPGRLNEPSEGLPMPLWTWDDGSGLWTWFWTRPEACPGTPLEAFALTWLLARAAGTSWLCFPSYVVITDLRSCDALSTCFLTVHPALVHL